MGYNTDFIGHIDVHPPLNDHEQAYLTVFARSPRCAPGQSPYAVPGNPAAELADPTGPLAVAGAVVRQYIGAEGGVPGPWCGWVPAWSGECLSYDGEEKFYRPVEWMRYLIDHFLCGDARAASSGLDYFEHFTFDHVLDGVVAGSRRDTCELFLIEVRGNAVTKAILRQGDPQPWELEPLPYQEMSDDRKSRRRRNSRPKRRPIGH